MNVRQLSRCAFVLTIVLAAQLGRPALRSTHPPVQPTSVLPDKATFGRLPLQFEVNEGQVDAAARFLAHGQGYALFLTPHEVVLRLPSARVRLQFVGAAPAPELVGLDRLPGTVNYYLGRDRAQWRTGISTYARVKYEGIYPGVDAVFYGNQRQLEHDFVVAPGHDPDAITLRAQGANALAVDRAGDLIVSVAGGALRLLKPFIYQEVDGVRRPVRGGYILKGEGLFGFQVSAYDASRPLIIDPVLSYSTYLGGDADDYGYAVTVDSVGNVYLTGSTNSTNWPVSNAAQGTFGGGGVSCPSDLPTRVCYDAFVTKLNAAGNTILYSTYLGLPGDDEGRAIAVDPAGNAYVTGRLSLAGDPPLEDLYIYPYALVAKLGPTGNLIYGGAFGGDSSGVIGLGIAADSAGRAYVTGEVDGGTIPTTSGAIQPARGEMIDAFVSVFSPDGYVLYSTYLGGSGDYCGVCESSGRGIAVDGSGYIYVTGLAGPSFPVTANAFQREFRGFWQAFVVQIDPTRAGTAGLVYSTLLGGSQTEVGQSIALDPAGKVYVTGAAKSDDLPTTAGAYDRSCGTDGLCNPTTVCVPGTPPVCETKAQEDVFVAKFDLARSGSASLLYSTYVGGSGRDEGSAIAVDASGKAYVTGFTVSPDFPTVNPLQPTHGGNREAIVFTLNPSASQLVHSTFMGGGGDDEGYGIALDASGNTYVTGYTGSGAFPIVNPLRPRSGGWEAFIAKIQPLPAPPNLTPRLFLPCVIRKN
jgi:hypothetical protein